MLISMALVIMLIGCSRAGSVSYPQAESNLALNHGVIKAHATCNTTEARFLAAGSTYCMVEVTLAGDCVVQNPTQLYSVLLQNAYSLSNSADGFRARIVQGDKVREDWVKAALPGLQIGLVNGRYVGETQAILNGGDGTVIAGRNEAKQKFGAQPNDLAVWPPNLINCPSGP